MKEKKPKIKKPTLTEQIKKLEADLCQQARDAVYWREACHKNIAAIGKALCDGFSKKNSYYGDGTSIIDSIEEILFEIGKLKQRTADQAKTIDTYQIEERIQKLEEATQTKIGG